MRVQVHYLSGRTAGRTEQLRQAIRVAHASGLKVGVSLGNGVLIIPPGYALDYTGAGRVALRTPEGSRVVYRPRALQERHKGAPVAYVRATDRWMD